MPQASGVSSGLVNPTPVTYTYQEDWPPWLAKSCNKMGSGVMTEKQTRESENPMQQTLQVSWGFPSADPGRVSNKPSIQVNNDHIPHTTVET